MKVVEILSEGKGELPKKIVAVLAKLYPTDAGIQDPSRYRKDGDHLEVDIYGTKDFFFHTTLPALFNTDSKWVPTMVVQEGRNTRPWTVHFMKRSPPVKRKLKKGYHYTSRSNAATVLANGLKAQESVENVKMIESPFGGYQGGLYNEPRAFFYEVRDDEEAEETFGSGLVCLEVNLEGIPLFRDETFIADDDEEEEFGTIVYTTQDIPKERIKKLT